MHSDQMETQGEYSLHLLCVPDLFSITHDVVPNLLFETPITYSYIFSLDDIFNDIIYIVSHLNMF